MAIKIDLLPGYVGLRRKRNWLAGISFVLVTIVGTGMYLAYYKTTLDVQTALENEQAWQAAATEATKYKTDADAKIASLIPVQTTVNFFADATQTGPRRAAVVDMVKRYIIKDALVATIDIPDGRTVSMVAAVSDTDSYSNLLLNLRKGTVNYADSPLPTVWAQLPSAAGPKGYPNTPRPPLPPPVLPIQAEAKRLPITVNINTQLTSDLAFTTPVPLADAGAPAAPGAPGAPPAGAPPTGAPTSTPPV